MEWNNILEVDNHSFPNQVAICAIALFSIILSITTDPSEWAFPHVKASDYFIFFKDTNLESKMRVKAELLI